MNRRALVSAVVLAVALILIVIAVLRQSRDAGEPATAAPSSIAPPVEATGPAEAVSSGEDGDDTGPTDRMDVLIYFPALDGDGLVGEPQEIFLTAAPGDRAKQIIADLISGPETDLALHALPPGTRLRQIFVLEDGTGYADFSADLKQGIGGGSTEELLTVYAIVNSVTMNIAEIRRLGILINGRPIDTLNGHLDLRRPLPPDPALVLGRAQPLIVANDPADPSA